MTAELKQMVLEAQEAGFAFYAPFQGIVLFDVKLNQGGLLSLVVTVYTYTGGAHGMTTRNYINLDLTTGEPLKFPHLFADDAELARAAALIDAEVKAEPERFFIQGFSADAFQPDQDFYLTPNQAVVCFGLYEIAPYVAGIQEFAVPAP